MAIAVVLYLSGTHTSVDAPPLPWLMYVALAICFGMTGVALAVGNKHDARRHGLAAFSSWLQRHSPIRFSPHTRIASLAMLWFVRVEAFQPAFLWRFASEFPSPLVGRPAVMFRAVGRVALAAGTFIALVNLSFIAWPDAGAAPWRMLFRPPIAPATSLFYPILYALQAAFFGALIWRASRGRADERRRLLLFAIGIAAGSAPLLVNVLLETIPSYYAFVHSPVREQVVGGILFGALAVVPFVAAYSVLFDRIVDLKVVLRAALQYALARYTIIAVASVPLVAFVLVIYQQRAQPLEAFASGARPLLLGGTAAIASLALRSRHRLLAALDRRYFREEATTRASCLID